MHFVRVLRDMASADACPAVFGDKQMTAFAITVIDTISPSLSLRLKIPIAVRVGGCTVGIEPRFGLETSESTPDAGLSVSVDQGKANAELDQPDSPLKRRYRSGPCCDRAPVSSMIDAGTRRSPARNATTLARRSSASVGIRRAL